LIEERAQAVANPYNRARLRLTEISFDSVANQRHRFPKVEDWNAATIEDVKRFYEANYSPSNAGLALVGDFDAAKAKELIKKYFEPIPKRDAPPAPDIREPGRSAERREIVSDAAVPAPAVMISWRVPAVMDPDWGTVKRLGEVLGANEAARLHTALVKNAGVASSVTVNLEDSAGPNLLTASVVLAPGKDPAQVEGLVAEEIERIAREGVSQAELDALATDALRRRAFQLVSKTARAATMAQFLTAYGKIDAINDWEGAESSFSREAVQQMAKKYFGTANRTVLVVKR